MTHAEIAEAVACNNWQSFRMSMKGQPTTLKLDRLKMWIRFPESINDDLCCNVQRRNKQVQNYLNALARGGQIGPNSTVNKLLWNDIEVRR